MASGQRAPKPGRPIATVLEDIIQDLKPLGMVHNEEDESKWLRVLEDNLIQTERLLCRVQPRVISALPLPAVIISELIRYVDHSHKSKYDETGASLLPSPRERPRVLSPRDSPGSRPRSPRSTSSEIHKRDRRRSINSATIPTLDPIESLSASVTASSPGRRHSENRPLNARDAREDTIAGSDEDTEPPPSIAKFEPRVRPRTKRAKSLPPTDIIQSTILRLSSAQKARVIEQWNALVDIEKVALAKGVPETPIQKFTTVFFDTFMDCEPKARQLFDKLERSKRRKGLLKALEVIVSSLDDPFRLLTQLKRYSTMILIWGVEAKHVRAFSLSLANSLKAVLGSDIMTSDSKETWYLVVQRLADTLMGTFGELRDGTVGDLHRKSGSAWKRWKATLSHDTIHLVADHDKARHHDVHLQLVESVEPYHSEDPSSPSPFCFTVTTFGGATKSYCVDSQDDLNWWLSELKLRLDAYAVIRPLESPTNKKTPRGPSTPRDLISDRAMYLAFKKFSETKLALESVMFWKAAQVFHLQVEMGQLDSGQAKSRAEKIYRKYITGDLADGKFIVNVTNTAIGHIKRGLAAGGPLSADLFEDAASEIESFSLTSNFTMFLKTYSGSN